MTASFNGQLDLCGVKETVTVAWQELQALEVTRYIEQQILSHHQTHKKRLLIGIVGGPGSGKTLFSNLLSMFLAQKLNICNVCASADGYHLRNDTLIEKGNRSDKGLPHTMDSVQMCQDLLKLQDSYKQRSVYLPAYDRKIHDPVADAIKIEANIPVVILEGLYLIHWQDVNKALDFVVFIDAAKQSMKHRLTERKIKCGKTKYDALQHYDRIDAKTTAITAMGRYKANSIIRSDIVDQKQHESDGVKRIKYRQLTGCALL